LIGVTSLICSAVLLSTLTSDSLWTDEAFSAYMASQKSLGLLLSTLKHGDPSDQLTALYYIYLHAWTTLFSASEFALRAANIPFILLSSFALCWASQRVFHSTTLWILAALSPFSWAYAADARPHFALVAWSAICFAGLLGWLESSTPFERRSLPFLVLACLALGLAFNVLMILTIPPLIVIAAIYRLHKPGIDFFRWRLPVRLLAVPILAVLGYIGWGLSHGVPSEYSKPNLLSLASVLYRFAGLIGYGPNRRFDISFSPYLPWMITGAGLLLVGLGGAVLHRTRSRSQIRFIAIAAALLTGLLEVAVLSIVFQKQEDIRHLASLEPLFVLAIMAAFAGVERKSSLTTKASLFLIAAVWLCGDLRVRFSPDYRSQGEDFRSAVALSMKLQKSLNAGLAWVADPAAGGYYGLDLDGPRPCFPFVDDCHEAFRKVAWVTTAPAEYAVRWNANTIREWLAEHASRHRPVIVLISQTRHPMYEQSPWWPFLRAAEKRTQYHPRGFLIQIFGR